MTGVELIAAERQRQIEVEWFSSEHDDAYAHDQLAMAAVSYALPESKRAYEIHLPIYAPLPHTWPWGDRWWKPDPHDRIYDLIKAGALIAAEIDRLIRAAGNQNE